jgi:hypothetical protein
VLTEMHTQSPQAHHIHSSLREKIVEHVFIGESLRKLWQLGVYNVEILRSEIDAQGYDLVMCQGNIIRHIQLKTGVSDKISRKPSGVSIPVALSEKPSGCVIWIELDNALNIKCFWWFDDDPGKPLPPLGDKVAKRIGRTADGKRPMRTGHRILNTSQFTQIKTLDEIMKKLFTGI